VKYFFLLLSVFAYAQSKAQGSVEVITDPDVVAIEKSRTWARASNDGKVQGYRVMIGFHSTRSLANAQILDANKKFKNKYAPVLKYDEPNFKVYIGEFVDKEDAEAAMAEIRKKFPMARVVSDLIKAPAEEEEE
jgi:hypothetical protein